MKVSIDWLKELVDLKVSLDELIQLIPMRTIGLKETTEDFLELDMKGYNRADLLALRGVAYEVASITDSKVTFSEPKDSDYVWTDQSLPSTPVDIDEEVAPVQAVAKIEGLKFGKSPEEWVKKLANSGMRSVNNIADVTNLIMLEYGHPLHAFDTDTVSGETINVRRAKEGEEVTTLDGKIRKLITEDIVLADRKKALDVAGIMGSKETEVSGKTTSILLSASIFDPKMVRRTSQRLGLSSEASKRFYHGLTKKRLLQSMAAAIKMYREIGGKLTALTIKGNTEDEVRKTNLRLSKTNSLIGVDLAAKQVEEYLEKLYFNLRKKDEDTWEVTSPYWRLDINIEEDLIEEVARMHGYEKIPAQPLKGELPEKTDQSLFELIYSLKKNLSEQGLTEVQTYSFYSTRVLKSLGFTENENEKFLLKVANPISSETEYLRMSVWPNFLEVADKNLRQGIEDVAIFEIGKVYSPEKDGLPEEGYELSILISDNTDTQVQQIYQIIKSVFQKLNIKAEVEKSEVPPVVKNIFHSNKFFAIKFNGEMVGGLSEVHPRITDKFGISKKTAILGIHLNKFLK